MFASVLVLRRQPLGGRLRDSALDFTASTGVRLYTGAEVTYYLERFLRLSEACRTVSAPGPYAELIRDCARLADVPVEGYRRFIDEFVQRVGEVAELLQFAKGTVEVDPVLLEIDAHEQLIERIARRLKATPG